jgi:hypothetical protein
VRDNIKINFREIGWGGMECVDLPQDEEQWRDFVNMAITFLVP